MMCQLDLPARTTRDYSSPEVAPGIQAALDRALQEETATMLIDAK